MFEPLAIAYFFPYTLITEPFFIILLLLGVALLTKFPSKRPQIGAVLAITGIFEILLVPIVFLWGFLLGLCTLILGLIIITLAFHIPEKLTHYKQNSRLSKTYVSIALILVGFFVASMSMFVAFALGPIGMLGLLFIEWSLLFSGLIIGALAFVGWIKKNASEKTKRKIKKVFYGLIIGLIAFFSVIICLRVTNTIHAQWFEDYPSYDNSVNLTIRGTVNEIHYNYEINTGYSYHIFPAYLILNITEFVWAGNMTHYQWDNEVFANQTFAAEYWLNYGTITITYDKDNPPKVSTYQTIEVSGHYCIWMEDSIFSEKLIITPEIKGYIKII